MATLSQGFLSGLSQPSFGKNLGMLGTALGSVPAVMAEREKKQERLANVSNISNLVTQSINAANAGNTEDYNKIVTALQEQIDTAKNPDEQKLAQQALNNVRNQRSILNAKVKTNQTNDVAKLLRTINNPKSSSADVAEATKNLGEYNDEAVVTAAMGAINNENTYNRSIRVQKQEVFLRTVQPDIANAVQNNDIASLDGIIKQADNLGIGPQVRATVNGLREFEERQEEIKVQQKLNKTGPITEDLRQVVEDTLDTFPQSAREQFKRAIGEPLRLYEEHAKNYWDEKQGIWKANGQSKANTLEANIRAAMSRFQTTNLTNNINTSISEINQADSNIEKARNTMATLNPNNSTLRRQATTNLAIKRNPDEIKKLKTDGKYEALFNKELTSLVNIKRLQQQNVINLAQADLYEAKSKLDDIGKPDDTVSGYNITEELKEQIEDAKKENEDYTERQIIKRLIADGIARVEGNSVYR